MKKTNSIQYRIKDEEEDERGGGGGIEEEREGRNKYGIDFDESILLRKRTIHIHLLLLLLGNVVRFWFVSLFALLFRVGSLGVWHGSEHYAFSHVMMMMMMCVQCIPWQFELHYTRCAVDVNGRKTFFFCVCALKNEHHKLLI